MFLSSCHKDRVRLPSLINYNKFYLVELTFISANKNTVIRKFCTTTHWVTLRLLGSDTWAPLTCKTHLCVLFQWNARKRRIVFRVAEDWIGMMCASILKSYYNGCLYSIIVFGAWWPQHKHLLSNFRRMWIIRVMKVSECVFKSFLRKSLDAWLIVDHT